jgi:hypothetical protein
MIQSAAQTIARAISPSQTTRDELTVQRHELMSQFDALDVQRRAVLSQAQRLPRGVERNLLETRLSELDGRSAAVDRMLAENARELAFATPTAGTIVAPHEPFPHIPNEYVTLGGLFMVVAILPLSIALARRLWKRGTTAIAAVPSEVLERMHRIEAAVESTAIEVERIGEGQRFLTKLMSDHLTALGEGAARAQLAASPKERSSVSHITPH